MKIVSYNINSCNQQKIDYLLGMNADVYIVPEMANPKNLVIPEEYESEWIGEYDSKGLGMLWKKEFNAGIEHYTPSDLNYFISLKTSKGVIVGAWPTMFGVSSKIIYPKIFMLAMEELTRRIGNTPCLIAGDMNCYVGQGGESKAYNIKTIGNFLGEKGYRSLYHAMTQEKMGEESAHTYHHQFKEDFTFFIDYVFTNMPNRAFKLGEWNRDVSDHHPQFIEI